MNKNPNKIKKSEDARLNSLIQKTNEYKIKRDSVKQLANQVKFLNFYLLNLFQFFFNYKNKKVYFSDNDSSHSDEEVTKTTKKLKSATLFSDDDTSIDEKIEFKTNLNEEKANKLLDLKTKYANDTRFQIDERFIESDNDDQEALESNEIDNEKEKSLRILEEITGKTIRREVGIKKTKLDHDKTQNEPRMVRYDPTKEEHKVFEASKMTINDEKTLKLAKQEEKNQETQKPLVDETKFYEVQEDIKSRICSNEVFKFKFGGDSEQNESKEPEILNEHTFGTRSLTRKPLDFLNKDLNVNDSSSDDDYDDEPQNEEEICEEENQILEESHNFLPLLSDTKIKEALQYFVRPKKLHDIREAWKNQREKLVDEYKKKHSRAIRNQRKKESEKKLPWKNKHLKKPSNKTKK